MARQGEHAEVGKRAQGAGIENHVILILTLNPEP